MKNQINSCRFLAQSLTAAICLATFVPRIFATNVSEPPPFSQTSPGSVYTLTLGTNTFSGTVTTGNPNTGQKWFQVTVPTGMRMTQAAKNFVAGGGVSGANCTFNYETISGTGAGTFSSGYPLSSGTYQAEVSADFSVGNAWSMTFVVGPLPDYSVSTTSGYMTITDNSTNSDTLNVTNPSAGNIKFTATGQTFSVNGGPLLTNATGNILLTAVTDIQVNIGSSNDTVNVSGFSGTTFPNLTVYGGAGNDTVNFNGSITFAAGNYLDVELQLGSPALNSVTVAPGASLITSGTGTISIYCSENISLTTGAGLEVQDGDLDVEANQQTPATSGNFVGINLDGATLKSTGAGYIYAYGTGGNDSGGYQLGVQVINAGRITGGNPGFVIVHGNGGNSTGIVNRGVTVNGVGSVITSSGGPVYITGNAGTNGSYFGIGVSVLNGGQICARGTGSIQVTCTGAGHAGSGYNQGLELISPNSLISSSGGSITINGTAGPGGSSGIYLADNSSMTTPATGGNILLYSDSDSLDSTVSINTTNPASSVTFGTETFGTLVDLGGANIVGNPATLGLTDAELDRVNTSNLYLGLNCGGVTISAPITQPYATNLVILPGLFGALYAANNGTDISLTGNGTVSVHFGAIAFPVTGPSPDSGYPQLKITGRVEINTTSLNLSNSTYAGNLGDTFTLISNDGTNPVIGTFNGLPEGSFVKLNGQPARIYYDGGDGNDVVLVRSLPKLSDGSLTNGQWHFSVTGFPTNAYTIQATTNFINWTNIGTATTDTNGHLMFIDSNAYQFSYRFYRTTN